MRAADWRAVGAAGLLALVLPPQRLPHPLMVDVLIGAAALLFGYAATALLLRTPLGKRRFDSRIARLANRSRPLLVVGLLAAAGLGTQIRLSTLHQEIDMAQGPAGQAFVAVGGAVVVAVTVLLLAAAIRRTRKRPLLVMVFLPVLVWALASAGSGPGAGGKGTEFLEGARDAASISALTHRPASTPHRIYVPVDAAPTHRSRARLAVEATDQAGGMTSSAVLLVIPTGSGWVNSRIAGNLEELYDGDLTTVAVQYATTPSWVAYLKGGGGVQESAAELIRAMRERIDRLPADQRPDLLVYGESLGAWGLVPTLRETGSQVDAALLTGLPGSETISDPNTRVFNHPDDPVPHWRPRLNPVSFLRVSADAISSEAVPVGHGHRYGKETTPAWCDLLELPTCT